MDKKRKENAARNKEGSKDARSLTVAKAGIKTGHDFARMMSAIMSDTIEGRITPAVANATCNAGGKLIKIVEMQIKYGHPDARRRVKTLMLATAELL